MSNKKRKQSADPLPTERLALVIHTGRSKKCEDTRKNMDYNDRIETKLESLGYTTTLSCNKGGKAIDVLLDDLANKFLQIVDRPLKVFIFVDMVGKTDDGKLTIHTGEGADVTRLDAVARAWGSRKHQTPSDLLTIVANFSMLANDDCAYPLRLEGATGAFIIVKPIGYGAGEMTSNEIQRLIAAELSVETDIRDIARRISRQGELPRVSNHCIEYREFMTPISPETLTL